MTRFRRVGRVADRLRTRRAVDRLHDIISCEFLNASAPPEPRCSGSTPEEAWRALLCEGSVSPAAVEKFVRRTPRTVLTWYDIDHFQPFSGAHAARIASYRADWLKPATTHER